jgi:hypothetical protein
VILWPLPGGNLAGLAEYQMENSIATRIIPRIISSRSEVNMVDNFVDKNKQIKSVLELSKDCTRPQN